jgi:hypothetical protein
MSAEKRWRHLKKKKEAVIENNQYGVEHLSPYHPSQLLAR